MSNTIWDWWFGDGPLPHAATTRQERRRLGRLFSFINGNSGRRRFWVFLAVVGTSPAVAATWAVAAEPIVENPVRKASFGWAPTLSFTMIESDESESGSDSEMSLDAAKKAAEDASNADGSAADESLNEDQLRRKRLRDLLGEDAEMSFRDDKEDEKKDGDKKKDQDKDDEDEDDEDDRGVFAEPFIEERLPEILGGRFVLPPIRAVSIDQKPIGNGRVPESLNAGEELPLVALPEDGYSRLMLAGGGVWPQLIRPWAAPNTYSHPLYFEDRMLERHGHERWGCWQPLASGTRFFTTLPMLPYLATIQEPCDIVYSKGYYRAGSPVPKLWQRPPLERRAVIVGAAAVATGFIAIP